MLGSIQLQFSSKIVAADLFGQPRLVFDQRRAVEDTNVRHCYNEHAMHVVEDD